MNNPRYLFVTKHQTWTNLMNSSEKFWPIKERYIKKLSLKKDDEIIVYLTRLSSVAGIIQVTGDIERHSDFHFEKDIYQYKLPIQFKKVLPDISLISIKPLITELLCTKKVQDNWGCKFQNAVIKINDIDFELLSQKIHEQLHSAG